MDDAQALAWLLIQQLAGLSRRSACRLIDHYRDPERILSAHTGALRPFAVPEKWLAARRAIHAQGLRAEAFQRASASWQTLRLLGAQLIPYGDQRYPPLLQEIADPPPLLAVCGDASLLARPQLAMVGSRRCSRMAADTAYAFAWDLAGTGLVICSGLALGVDASSHRGALESGTTVAVLGAGLDVVYPRANRALYRQIAERGVLVSEYPVGQPPLPAQFPQRNRVISGLSLGVLVVEAAMRSGSLITARQALDQNREVFALPGSIHNPASRGCNALIRQGAKLVDCVDDILDELQGWLPLAKESAPAAVDAGIENDQPLLRDLGFEPTSLDELLARCRLPVAELQSRLLDLQLRGLIEQTAAGWQRCR